MRSVQTSVTHDHAVPCFVWSSSLVMVKAYPSKLVTLVISDSVGKSTSVEVVIRKRFMHTQTNNKTHIKKTHAINMTSLLGIVKTQWHLRIQTAAFQD
jgi:hypothetical protein